MTCACRELLDLLQFLQPQRKKEELPADFVLGFTIVPNVRQIGAWLVRNGERNSVIARGYIEGARREILYLKVL